MRRRAILISILSAGVLGASVLAGAPPAAAVTTPTLVDIRAVHVGDVDRVTFEFRDGLPAERSLRYVDRLVGDPSGLPVWMAGGAILSLRLFPAQAHTATGAATTSGRLGFATPNVMQVTRSGDFEAVLNHGIGLARRTQVRMFTLRNPDRVVVEVGAAMATEPVSVYLVNMPNFEIGQEPYVTAVRRPAIRGRAPFSAMQRLFAGPTRLDRVYGLESVRSGATGFADLTIADGIARVRLTGGCDSKGSTLTIAAEIMPTLRQFPGVRWVKIYDPAGHTEDPTGRSDSIPVCLEP